ncbi:PAS domain-containing sensor histidine kinase [Terasakiella brassicae]|uniref:PAS domain-containing sensor histidine kinase n=1 Tax=Terasakiella brassicae TaxID=1634917 RepID=UPI001668F310|nr:ATP-binding protein [Terasakiella brassicae]
MCDDDKDRKIATLRKRLSREVRAREQAEQLLESKALELFQVNQNLLGSIQKAKNRSARVNAIMNSIKDSVVATNQKMEILDVNKSCVGMWGIPYAGLMGRSVLEFVENRQIADYEALCLSASADEQDEIKEFNFRTLDGGFVPAEVKISTFQHDDERFLLHLIRNVSNKKRLQKEREAMQEELANAAKWEAVGQLAGGIAHEINTPAQYIGDNLHFLSECNEEILEILNKALELKKACEQNGQYLDYVQEIDRLIEAYDLEYLCEEVPQALKQSAQGIAQVSHIVRAMKNFSHPGTEEKKPFDINAAIDTTLTVSRNEWKNIATVVTDFDEHVGLVPCIPGGMNQVFLNIIVNAAHAIDVKGHETMGEIRIVTRKLADQVEIVISDTGCGMPPEVVKNIFNPFFTTKEVGRGTGQGLAIVNDIIVQKHKGTIKVATKEGKGTSFIIRIPCK